MRGHKRGQADTILSFKRVLVREAKTGPGMGLSRQKNLLVHNKAIMRLGLLS